MMMEAAENSSTNRVDAAAVVEKMPLAWSIVLRWSLNRAAENLARASGPPNSAPFFL